MTYKTGKVTLLTLAAAAALFFLYFFRLDAAGLLSTDEPRYAAIGREMARSGDWITPRLWGAPWFEKPVLIYWTTGLGTVVGWSPDLAPRLPVAIMSACFLVLFFFALRREWGSKPAFYATAILGSSAGWLAFSQCGLPDLPLAALFNGALLLVLPWLHTGSRRLLPYSAALLGLAVLAKGLVPLVLVLPLLWFARKRITDLLHPAVLAAFAATALPWYVLCAIRNGRPFLDTFFFQHQLGRFYSGELQHVQPVWFYAPVLLGLLFPWTVLLLLAARRSLYRETHTALFAAIAVWGLVFFSLSTNKLPGYLLPLLPSIAALLGLSLHRVRFALPWLAFPILTLAWVPVISAMLPTALAWGIRKAWPVPEIVRFEAALLMLPLMLAAAAAMLAERAGRREWAVAGMLTLTASSAIWMKVHILPAVDRIASARNVYRNPPKGAIFCAEPMPRSLHYGLNYYFGRPVPDCKPGQSGLNPGPAK